ncbi:hypothetical protein EKO27_g9404 [Xylaria grammica]|uniref:UDP-N-acetylglucosamine transferase subunit ALG13 n=1 Tax=Xylaria grammica TaxID=363999 RepID=A0A439CU73_9PEZI|nr:hypothetical protein EKO27_g9404 [Xylaria grammica]
MSEANLDSTHNRLTRTAFVTIGATAGFRSLLQEVVTPKFLTTLKSLDFTDLVVQCGPDLEYFETIRPDHSQKSYGVKITSFSYAPDLKKYFAQASRGNDEDGGRDCGVIISHAGSGSIIGALEFDSKLVTVPNPELMDNHQLEIAEDMESKGFLVHGTLGSVAEAVEKIDTLTLRKWPPGPSPGSSYQKGGLWEAINELMPQSS